MVLRLKFHFLFGALVFSNLICPFEAGEAFHEDSFEVIGEFFGLIFIGQEHIIYFRKDS